MTREVAISYLASMPVGSFVIRPSARDANNIIISVVGNCESLSCLNIMPAEIVSAKVQHVTITVRDGLHTMPDQSAFSSIDEIVSYYSTAPLPLENSTEPVYLL